MRREVASEQREEAGDRNVGAGGYFLNERSSLRINPDEIEGNIFR
jgi:hypothetical protein